jgi:hypothetical protein
MARHPRKRGPCARPVDFRLALVVCAGAYVVLAQMARSVRASPALAQD